MATYLLRRFSSDSNYDANIDFAVMTFTAEYARRIIARRDMFKAYKATDDRLYEMYFWEYGPVFYENIDDNVPSELDDHDYARKDDFVGPSDDHQARIECPQMVVTGDRVWWLATPKHTDIYITTAAIPMTGIEKVAAEG